MQRLLALPGLLSACLLLSACPTIDGTFDLSGLPSGVLGEAYAGQVAVLDYDGPVRFTLVSGELPPGLAMDAAGRVTGTPAAIGSFEVTILATDMRRVDDFQEAVPVAIDPPAGAFLGFDHTQLNNMAAVTMGGPGGMMRDVWVRISESGETGQESFTIDTGLYVPGVNGIAEEGMDDGGLDGRYDDVRILDIPFSDLEVEFSDWEPSQQDWFDPDAGYPNPHTPDGSPPVLHDDGTVVSGTDTGGASLRMIHPEWGELTTRVLVVPPDWCPAGTDYVCE